MEQPVSLKSASTASPTLLLPVADSCHRSRVDVFRKRAVVGRARAAGRGCLSAVGLQPQRLLAAAPQVTSGVM